MPIGSSALSAECSQVRKICCALSAECTPELTHLTALHNAVVHCVWSWMEGRKDLGKSKHDDHENEDKDGQVAY